MSILSISNLAGTLEYVKGDKPALHARAKELLALVNDLVADTRPGLGEFKWSAKARKELTIGADDKNQNPSLIVARDGDNVWHSNGYYVVKGEPSKRFEPYDVREMTVSQIMNAIPDVVNLVEVVATGTHKDNVFDLIEFSNGVKAQRLLVEYCIATIGGDVRFYNGGSERPIVLHNGVTCGVVMPIRR